MEQYRFNLQPIRNCEKFSRNDKINKIQLNKHSSSGKKNKMNHLKRFQILKTVPWLLAIVTLGCRGQRAIRTRITSFALLRSSSSLSAITHETQWAIKQLQCVTFFGVNLDREEKTHQETLTLTSRDIKNIKSWLSSSYQFVKINPVLFFNLQF